MFVSRITKGIKDEAVFFCYPPQRVGSKKKRGSGEGRVRREHIFASKVLGMVTNVSVNRLFSLVPRPRLLNIQHSSPLQCEVNQFPVSLKIGTTHIMA